MSKDARFEDGRKENPLQLRAIDPEDLQVVSALTQDAVFPTNEIKWDTKKRCFSILLNRFRWEKTSKTDRVARDAERVRSILSFTDVIKVSSQGVPRENPDIILSLLSLQWEAGEDGTGCLVLTLSGDGAIALSAECLNVTLKDVTRPYLAPSGKQPKHPDA